MYNCVTYFKSGALAAKDSNPLDVAIVDLLIEQFLLGLLRSHREDLPPEIKTLIKRHKSNEEIEPLQKGLSEQQESQSATRKRDLLSPKKIDETPKDATFNGDWEESMEEIRNEGATTLRKNSGLKAQILFQKIIYLLLGIK